MITAKDTIAWLRRCVAVGVTAAGVVTAQSGTWTECHDLVLKTGATGTAHVCEAPSLADVPTVGGLFVVLLLLLPDLSEITLPGGLALKRRVEAQQAEIDAQNARYEAFEQRLELASQAAATASSYGNVVNFDGLSEFIEQTVDARVRLRQLESGIEVSRGARVKEKATAETSGKIALESEIEQLSSLDTLDLQRELIRRWRELAPLLRLADDGRRQLGGANISAEAASRLAELGDDGVARLIDWRDALDPAARVVDQARRAVVVDPDALSQNELATVAALALELRKSATDLGLLGEVHQ